MPLRFAKPSPPSGWLRDFHPQAIEHARHATNPLRWKSGDDVQMDAQLLHQLSAARRRRSVSVPSRSNRTTYGLCRAVTWPWKRSAPSEILQYSVCQQVRLTAYPTLLRSIASTPRNGTRSLPVRPIDQPDIGQILVDEVARPDLPAMHIRPLGDHPIPPEHRKLVCLGIDDARLILSH
jgi:hypothetical protein